MVISTQRSTTDVTLQPWPWNPYGGCSGVTTLCPTRQSCIFITQQHTHSPVSPNQTFRKLSCRTPASQLAAQCRIHWLLWLPLGHPTQAILSFSLRAAGCKRPCGKPHTRWLDVMGDFQHQELNLQDAADLAQDRPMVNQGPRNARALDRWFFISTNSTNTAVYDMLNHANFIVFAGHINDPANLKSNSFHAFPLVRRQFQLSLNRNETAVNSSSWWKEITVS